MEMARLISFVSTEALTVQHLRVTELVTLGRFPHTSRFGSLTISDHRIIHDAMEHTGVYELRHAGLHELSDGERQKVMIARALAQDTPVMILDEPTAFLDLPARHEILRLLSDLSQQKNKLVLFSTHDLAIAMREADKLWLMSEQGLLQGSPEDLLISGGFRTLFYDSELRFDPGSMSFSFDRELKGSVSIDAEGDLYTFTTKAMERIGFAAVPYGQAAIHIRVVLEKEQPVWMVTGTGKEASFESLYALSSYVNLLS
jgi:iron complex transport system ATP-binding protein